MKEKKDIKPLKIVRVLNGFSQVELADQAGVDLWKINQHEVRGKPLTDIEKAKIAAVLGEHVKRIFPENNK